MGLLLTLKLQAPTFFILYQDSINMKLSLDAKPAWTPPSPGPSLEVAWSLML